jgi:small basic protein (TIGR04137 family)
MSIHKSLFLGGSMNADRSVFTRRERLERLSEKGEFTEGDSVYGLRKVRTMSKSLSKKQIKAIAAAKRLIEEQAAAEEASKAAAEEEVL